MNDFIECSFRHCASFGVVREGRREVMGVGAARGRGSEDKEIEIYKDRGG